METQTMVNVGLGVGAAFLLWTLLKQRLPSLKAWLLRLLQPSAPVDPAVPAKPVDTPILNAILDALNYLKSAITGRPVPAPAPEPAPEPKPDPQPLVQSLPVQAEPILLSRTVRVELHPTVHIEETASNVRPPEKPSVPQVS